MNDLSLKYHRFAPLGCQDIGIRRFEFVAKTQFLCLGFNRNVTLSLSPGNPGWKGYIGISAEESHSFAGPGVKLWWALPLDVIDLNMDSYFYW